MIELKASISTLARPITSSMCQAGSSNGSDEYELAQSQDSSDFQSITAASLVFDLRQPSRVNLRLREDAHEFDNSSICSAKTLLGCLETQKYVRQKRQSYEPEESCIISVQLPSWLLPRRYQIRSRRQYRGWNYHIRAYHIVPTTAPVFKLCMEGDINGLQNIFTSGLATPFDVDRDGASTLHVSMPHSKTSPVF